MQKNFADQQKERQQEIENYNKELAALHEKKLQAAINEKTASLKAGMESLQQENTRLNIEIKNSKTYYMKIALAAIAALIIGFILFFPFPQKASKNFLLIANTLSACL